MKSIFQIIAFVLFMTSVFSESCNSYEDHCPLQNHEIVGSSYPTCGKTTPNQESENIYSVEVCAYESPNLFGGNFDVGVSVFGTITRIDQINNHDNNCSQPQGKGTGVFTTNCQCSGDCQIAGYWKVYYDTSVQPPMTFEQLLKIDVIAE